MPEWIVPHEKGNLPKPTEIMNGVNGLTAFVHALPPVYQQIALSPEFGEQLQALFCGFSAEMSVGKTPFAIDEEKGVKDIVINSNSTKPSSL